MIEIIIQTINKCSSSNSKSNNNQYNNKTELVNEIKKNI